MAAGLCALQAQAMHHTTLLCNTVLPLDVILPRAAHAVLSTTNTLIFDQAKSRAPSLRLEQEPLMRCMIAYSISRLTLNMDYDSHTFRFWGIKFNGPCCVIADLKGPK